MYLYSLGCYYIVTFIYLHDVHYSVSGDNFNNTVRSEIILVDSVMNISLSQKKRRLTNFAMTLEVAGTEGNRHCKIMCAFMFTFEFVARICLRHSRSQ